MSQTVAINAIAEVRSGYTFRKAAPGADAGPLLGLQISDIRGTTVVDPAQLSPIEWQGEGGPPVLVPGDVVFAAKGAHNRAAVFGDERRQVVPSNQFLVLSVRKSALVSPAFLCWLLNFSDTQKRLAEIRTGTSMPAISKKVFQEFTVALPAREVQEKILRLSDLWEEERRLAEALIVNRETMVGGMYRQLLSGAVK